MKCKHLLLAAALLACACSRPDISAEQSLLQDLITRLDSVDVYVARYDARLSEAREALHAVPLESEELINAYIDMGMKYSKFISDSSIVYFDRAARLAERLGNHDKLYDALLRKAGMLIHTGFYLEGSMILDTVPRDAMKGDNLSRYYNIYRGLYHDAYQELGSKPEMRSEFVAKYEAYRDTLLALLPENNNNSLREREKICARNGDLKEALALNARRMDSLSPDDTQGRALALYDRHAIYFFYTGHPVEEHIEDLLESAILDIVSANQDIGSLRYVEHYLTKIGDLANAKRISDYYYSTMVRFGSRSRLLWGAEQTIRINDSYAARLAKQKRRIQTGLGIIVVMSLLLLIITIQAIRSRNEILLLNEKLERTGKTANSYVLGFFQLYSSYITRLLALRAKINTNTRKGNTKYVLDLTDPSKDITNDELKQMYQNFDRAFLDIFPDFVDDFNALLRPECRIELKPTELLNMELRIFAIIKLGITDSAKISELLHCSIKTVYNKRSGINTKLLVPKADFAEELAKI